MELLLIILACILFILAFSYFWNLFVKQKKPSQKQSQPARKGPPTSNCPICNSPLYPGERIASKIFNKPTTPDQRCIINGCPHCFPYSEPGIQRKCPVCKKNIPQDGYLIARMFYRPPKKNHVHIVGCTECHKR